MAKHTAAPRIPTLQRAGTFTSGLVRPAGLRREQLAVLVRDASTSMSGQKAADADAASRALVEELARPENRGGFSIAVVDFNTSAAVKHAVDKAEALADRLARLSPGGGTNIATALAEAAKVVRGAAPALTAIRPVALLFSDGRPSSDPRAAAADLRTVADVVTVAFGSDADEALLRELATSPEHAYRCADGRELRRFFASVGATLSMSLASGARATGALGTIGR